VANTLAYYDTATIIALKRFIVQAPGARVEYLKGVVSICIGYECPFLQKLDLAENVCKEKNLD